MIPESLMRTAMGVADFWVEKFPEGFSSYPRGLIKRISQPMVHEKDRMSPRQYEVRVSVLWYDHNTIGFDAKQKSIMDAVYSIESDAKVKNVTYIDRHDGYDPVTDKHVMNIDFFIKIIE